MEIERFAARRTAVVVACGVAALAWSWAAPVAGDACLAPGAQSIVCATDVLGRTFGCLALVVIWLLLPGLLAGAVRRRPLPFALLALPGLAITAGAGCFAWALPNFGRPALLVATSALLGFGAYCATKRAPGFERSGVERRVLLIALVVAAFAIAKTEWSLGPRAELYAGTTARTLAVGDRSDSTISYRVAQLVTNHLGPYDPQGAAYFGSWTFSARGPIAGVLAATIITVEGARPPPTAASDPWAPFDREGFEAYRIALIVAATLSLLALFGLVAELRDQTTGYAACVLAGFSPFFLHETYFTWPKLMAASFVLSALWILSKSAMSGLRAGVLFGVAFLTHPGALFGIVSAFGAIAASSRPFVKRVVTAVALAIGLGACVAGWHLVNEGHDGQSQFLSFVYAPRDGTWPSERLFSLAATLVPGYLLVFDADSNSINAIPGFEPPATAADQVDFLFWNTLPFGVGIFVFPYVCGLAWCAARADILRFSAIVLVPFCVFWIYWGVTETGLMRESLQWWFLVFIAYSTALAGVPHPIIASRLMRLRIIEAAWLFFGSTAWDAGAVLGTGMLTDVFWIAVAAAALAAMVALTSARALGATRAGNVDRSLFSRYAVPGVAFGVFAVCSVIGISLAQRLPPDVAPETIVPPGGGAPLARGAAAPELSIDSESHGGHETIMADPAIPSIAIGAGEALRINGWSSDPNTLSAGSGMLVQIDGSTRIRAGYGSDRPDVKRALGLESSAVGFQADIPAKLLPTGRHRISFLLIDAARRSFLFAGDRVKIDVAEPRR